MATTSNLMTLGHPNPSQFNAQDVQQLRSLVVWLEDNHVKSGAGEGFRDTYAANWQVNFDAYLDRLGFPRDWFAESQNILSDAVSWIVGQAIQQKYAPKARELNVRASARMMDAVDLGQEDKNSPAKKLKVSSSNPIENMDFQSEEFKDGVKRLQKLLEVPDIHPDHLVGLEACCKIIQSRLNQKSLRNPGKAAPKGETFNLKDHSFGVDGVNDPALAEAMKILRLTHLTHLRDLQSDINAAIETVQAATANPKTDTRLGKVGRWLETFF